VDGEREREMVWLLGRRKKEGKGERLGLERMGNWKKREFEDFWEALRDGFRGLWVVAVVG